MSARLSVFLADDNLLVREGVLQKAIVDLTDRLQDLARPAVTTVLGASTPGALSTPQRPDRVRCEALADTLVKDRRTPVSAFRITHVNEEAVR